MKINTLHFKNIFLILSLFIFSWVVFAIFHEESPDVGRNGFYATTHGNFPDNQNVAIALAGLNAPSGADVFKHGRFVIDTYKNTLNDFLAKLIIEKAGKLSFVGNSEEFDCWLDYSIEKTNENCASPERIKLLLIENKELLSRYAQLFDLPCLHEGTWNGQTVINLNKLISAEIQLDVEAGNAEAAYKKWFANHQFISNVLKQEGNALNRAIFLVVDGINLDSLENLLFKSPETGINHFDKLNPTLKSNGLESYNLKGMMRAEYTLVNDLLKKQKKIAYLHPEFIRNRIYRAQMDFLDKAQKPPSTFEVSRNELNKKYGFSTLNLMGYYWLDPYNSMLANMITGGFIKGLYLVSSMHTKNSLICLLNLSVQIKQQKIVKIEIQAFLDRAGIENNCPFTNKPMQFDSEKNIIFCENPETKSRVAQVRI